MWGKRPRIWSRDEETRRLGLVDEIRHERCARTDHEKRVGFIDFGRTVIEQRVSDALFVARIAVQIAEPKLEGLVNFHLALKVSKSIGQSGARFQYTRHGLNRMDAFSYAVRIVASREFAGCILEMRPRTVELGRP